MPIVVTCSCGKKYKVGDDKAGMKMRCKACQGVIPIPAAEPAASDGHDDFGDDFGGEDFGGDDFGEPIARKPKSTGKKSDGKPKGKSKSGGKKKSGKSKSSEMAPAVKYSIAGGIVVVTAGIVLGILYARGVIGGGGASEPAPSAPSLTTSDQGAHAAPEVKKPSPTPKKNSNLPTVSGPKPKTVEVDLLPATTIEFLSNDPQYRGNWTFELQVRRNNEPISNPLTGAFGAKAVSASQPRVAKVDDNSQAAAKAAAARTAVNNELRQIGLAMHNYADIHGALPLADRDPRGSGQGLSWRVHLLPLLGYNVLYKQFNLKEAWNSPHNKALIAKIPPLYQIPGRPNDGNTSIHIFLGRGTPFGIDGPAAEFVVKYRFKEGKLDPNAEYVFTGVLKKGAQLPKGIEGKEVYRGSELKQEGTLYLQRVLAGTKSPVTFSQIKDGTSNTVLAVAAGPEAAAPWTKPGGVLLYEKDPWAPIGTISPAGLQAVFFDGHVATIPPNTPALTLIHLVQHADGQPVSIPAPQSTSPSKDAIVAAADLLKANPANSTALSKKTVRVRGTVQKGLNQGWIVLNGDGRRTVACRFPAAPNPAPKVGETVVIEGTVDLNAQQYITLTGSRVISKPPKASAGSKPITGNTPLAKPIAPAKTLSGHSGQVRQVAISRDGKLLAAANMDATIELWNLSTGKSIAILKGHPREVSWLAFSPDGTTLASSGYQDPVVRLWNVATAKPIRELKGEISDFEGLAYSSALSEFSRVTALHEKRLFCQAAVA